ncbi:histidine phosphatase family protein [Paramagnetospirillum kuznetsovii]|uniref:Histidine phosphatase family protein n=1 Tax=Paramagnetospirillum kuznetsovii TaxID=2053833 RepID=A0A364NX14_9PROT|nr:histidine phosphatase family protein [Paramagnetospirillum kuznetsovii]RAU21639.1 histidine phosphatase family protein [Paramagnetospirillum kuznetsovii]
MSTIILVRHGETQFNAEGRVQGWHDSALTPKGVAQAFRYGLCLRGLIEGGDGWRLVSSPLGRCAETTGILCEAAGLDAERVSYDARLKEINTGSLSGLLKSEIAPELRGGHGLDHWVFKSPDGETHAALSARLAQWLAGIRPSEKLVVVSHGIAGKVLRGLYLGLDPAEALQADSPQDAVFVLRDGAVTRVACG